MSSVQKFSATSALNSAKLQLNSLAGWLVIEVANGAAEGAQAFKAHVTFRDENGLLILPPYNDFTLMADGAYGIQVNGGTADTPGRTRHYFTAPDTAHYIEVELRRNECSERPLVLPPLTFEPDETRPLSPQIYQFAMDADVMTLEVEVANGKTAGNKAFLARIRFLDSLRNEVSQPSTDFPRSPTLGAYLYLAGGTPTKPAVSRRNFTPPPGAVTMEVELRSWHMNQPIRIAAPPRVVSDQRGANARTTNKALNISPSGEDCLNLHIQTAPMGTQIIAETQTKKPVVGIMSSSTREQLGEWVVEHMLPVDRYDLHWQRYEPGYLLLEVYAFPQSFGWQHALTLRDPTTTVELAVMLQKARAFGMTIVLISPKEAHRFPLLSRITDLFDVTLPAGGPLTWDTELVSS